MINVVRVSLVFWFLCACGSAVAQGLRTGEQVYQDHCASCHERPEETRAPTLAALQLMSFRNIGYALTDGKMKEQAAMLNTADRDALMGFLVSDASGIESAWISSQMCSSSSSVSTSSVRSEAVEESGNILRWGINYANHRYLTEAEAGLNAEGLQDLELAWSLGFPGAASMRSQPVIVDETLYLAVVDTAQLFSFDISDQPCVNWVYQSSLPLRSALNFSQREDGRSVVIANDSAARVHMLDANSGELLWMTDVKVNEKSQTTGASVMYNNRIFVPVSAFELNVGANAEYECCTSHGAVVALDAMTGEKIWVGHTMEEAVPTRLSREGVQQWGPSGAPIWSTPAIDVDRGVLYVGTGENTSIPATGTSDAVIAFDLEDGSIRWVFQASANDIFLTGCMFDPRGPNCPPASANSINADYDIGASIIIAQTSSGKEVLLAGQKSGELWVLDPDDSGELLWSMDVGPGGPLGGIHWGMAFDGERVFVPVNQVGAPGEDPDRDTGVHAIDVSSGERLWSFFNESDCSEDRQERMPSCENLSGLSAAPLIIGDNVLIGGLDGKLRIFSASSGALLNTIDTVYEYVADNGVSASGGSLDNATLVAANGLLLVSSGYSLVGSQGGNVLLAFKAKQ